MTIEEMLRECSDMAGALFPTDNHNVGLVFVIDSTGEHWNAWIEDEEAKILIGDGNELSTSGPTLEKAVTELRDQLRRECREMTNQLSKFVSQGE